LLNINFEMILVKTNFAIVKIQCGQKSNRNEFIISGYKKLLSNYVFSWTSLSHRLIVLYCSVLILCCRVTDSLKVISCILILWTHFCSTFARIDSCMLNIFIQHLILSRNIILKRNRDLYPVYNLRFNNRQWHSWIQFLVEMWTCTSGNI
jgi:hypothetical protein